MCWTDQTLLVSLVITVLNLIVFIGYTHIAIKLARFGALLKGRMATYVVWVMAAILIACGVTHLVDIILLKESLKSILISIETSTLLTLGIVNGCIEYISKIVTTHTRRCARRHLLRKARRLQGDLRLLRKQVQEIHPTLYSH